MVTDNVHFSGVGLAQLGETLARGVLVGPMPKTLSDSAFENFLYDSTDSKEVVKSKQDGRRYWFNAQANNPAIDYTFFVRGVQANNAEFLFGFETFDGSGSLSVFLWPFYDTATLRTSIGFMLQGTGWVAFQLIDSEGKGPQVLSATRNLPGTVNDPLIYLGVGNADQATERLEGAQVRIGPAATDDQPIPVLDAGLVFKTHVTSNDGVHWEDPADITLSKASVKYDQATGILSILNQSGPAVTINATGQMRVGNPNVNSTTITFASMGATLVYDDLAADPNVPGVISQWFNSNVATITAGEDDGSFGTILARRPLLLSATSTTIGSLSGNGPAANVVCDNNGLLSSVTAVAALSAAEVSWVKELADIFTKHTVSTVDNVYTEVARVTLVPGDMAIGKMYVTAKRTDAIGLYRAEAVTQAYYDGGAFADSDKTAAGPNQMDVHLVADGDDIVAEVRGVVGQSWDWDVTFMWRDA